MWAICSKLIIATVLSCLSWHAQANASFQQAQAACNNGDGAACNNLAVDYQDGEVVTKNPKKAIEFYTKACKLVAPAKFISSQHPALI